MRAGDGEEEKAESDASMFTRDMRGWYSPIPWASREEGFLERNNNSLEGKIGNKDDADTPF